MRLRSLAIVGLVSVWCTPARAYRPFDQTDADVAKPRELELEVGPLQLLHLPGRTQLAPNFVVNFGVLERVEAVVEGRSGIALGRLARGDARWAFDPSLLLKAVLREGSLQEAQGPSLALEAGVLLPDVPAGGSAGASLALIASQRWPLLTAHLNAQVERSRERSTDVLGGAIVEGPAAWRLRPVAEAWVARAGGAISTSLLGGAIWRVGEELSLDGAARVVLVPLRAVYEVRLGFTWALAV